MSKMKKSHPGKVNKDIGSKVTDSAQHQAKKKNSKED